jgi:hypothetical protein
MEPFNSSTGLDHSQSCQRRLCQHSLFCSGFQCDWEYRQSPNPPLVCLRSGLRLPIPGNSAQYFAVPHCSLSSTGSRPGRGDFSQQWDMIFSSMSWCFTFLFYVSRHASHGPRIEIRKASVLMLVFLHFHRFVLLIRLYSGAGV